MAKTPTWGSNSSSWWILQLAPISKHRRGTTKWTRSASWTRCRVSSRRVSRCRTTWITTRRSFSHLKNSSSWSQLRGRRKCKSKLIKVCRSSIGKLTPGSSRSRICRTGTTNCSRLWSKALSAACNLSVGATRTTIWLVVPMVYNNICSPKILPKTRWIIRFLSNNSSNWSLENSRETKSTSTCKEEWRRLKPSRKEAMACTTRRLLGPTMLRTRTSKRRKSWENQRGRLMISIIASAVRWRMAHLEEWITIHNSKIKIWWVWTSRTCPTDLTIPIMITI